MIKTFYCRETEKLFLSRSSSKFPSNFLRSAQRKLAILDAAERLEDLRIPPGNRLEKLKGDRQDQYSIRVNDQWQICFRCFDGHAYDVEIVDYH